MESRPLLGTDLADESAGSRLYLNVLDSEIATTALEAVRDEVIWQTMHHQTGQVPRLVCCQSSIDDDGSRPVYRHPSDETLPTHEWTPRTNEIRKAVEAIVGHPLNHALIQMYRGGSDYISEHSDKTLDIVPGSYIVNVSLGAQRTMRLRSKRPPQSSSVNVTDPPPRRTHRILMPHNSMLVMSLETNAEYLHGITADKRPSCERTPAEAAYDGVRISLTFRQIGTFLNADSSRIWGAGAIAKQQEDARPVLNGIASESEKLIRAFGAENQASRIDWTAVYGGGSDVLHLK